MDSLIELIFAVVIIVASAVWNKDSNKTTSGGSGDADLNAIEEFFKKHTKGETSTAATTGSSSASPRPAKKPRKDRKRPAAPAPTAAHESDEGPCLDDARSLEGTSYDQAPSLESAHSYESAPTLEGSANYERQRPEIRRTAGQTRSVARAQPRMKMTRQQLVHAFVMSELLNRYDLNRIFARVPGRRGD